MNEFFAPIDDIAFALKHSARLEELAQIPAFEHLDPEMVRDLMSEAARFFADVVSPTNRIGDEIGAVLRDGQVVLPDGYKAAYDAVVEAGWNRVSAPEEHGGAALPFSVGTAIIEMYGASNMGFAMCHGLSDGAIHAMEAHASDELKELYLGKMISGEWSGSMDLTEPQAGSDLGRLRCTAEPQSDGSYHLSGQKIFISFGDHDLTDNIIHLVLARTPDAPAGSRGISLFLAPKYRLNPDGSVGESNGIKTVSLEHKMGIRVSPTCVLSYGEDEPTVGWMIGQENQGLMCMFTMMNRERIFVGNQGLAIAERAYQQALDYAKERVQGRAIGDELGPGKDSTIIQHPDVRRMLMTMKAKIEAMRGMLYASAADDDIATHHPDAGERLKAEARLALVTPVVKAWLSDTGVEVTSLGIQVHGGVGFVEETGAAQHYRDARIAPIYEGTNGIQASDLTMRKLRLGDGAVVNGYLDEMRGVVSELDARPDLKELAEGLRAGIETLARSTEWLQERMGVEARDIAAGSTPYLNLFGAVAGATALARLAVAAVEDKSGEWSETYLENRVTLARFFIQQLLPQALGNEAAVKAGSGDLFAIAPDAL